MALEPYQGCPGLSLGWAPPRLPSVQEQLWTSGVSNPQGSPVFRVSGAILDNFQHRKGASHVRLLAAALLGGVFRLPAAGRPRLALVLVGVPMDDGQN